MKLYMALENVEPGYEYNDWNTAASATVEIDDGKLDAVRGAFINKNVNELVATESDEYQDPLAGGRARQADGEVTVMAEGVAYAETIETLCGILGQNLIAVFGVEPWVVAGPRDFLRVAVAAYSEN